jgi:hypothetical protein
MKVICVSLPSSWMVEYWRVSTKTKSKFDAVVGVRVLAKETM